MKTKTLFTFLITMIYASAFAQEASYLTMSWKQVASKMPDAWYGSDEAKAAAENVLLNQKDIGGWEKNTEFHQPLIDAGKSEIIAGKAEVGATFDNGATITEMRFLAKVYAHIPDERYKQAFEKGLNYIFISQYDTGAWPQFFPVRGGKGDYSMQITFNDDAMVNILKFLKAIYSEDKAFSALELNPEQTAKARTSFDAGIDCILKTQIVVNGQPTVWCAQHDEKTFAPAKARSYELPSFSGSESVGLVQLLMDLESPSAEAIAAVHGAVRWFEAHAISGIKIETELDSDGKKNRIVVEDKNAPAIWARFYDLENGKPYFSDRDGIKKNSLTEIGYERRNGYSWYTDAPSKVLAAYPAWKKKVEGE